VRAIENRTLLSECLISFRLVSTFVYYGAGAAGGTIQGAALAIYTPAKHMRRYGRVLQRLSTI